MSLEIKDGAIRMFDDTGRKTFDSNEELLYSSEEITGTVVLPQTTNSGMASARYVRTTQLSPTDLKPGAEIALGMVRMLSGYWHRDWFCVPGTLVTVHKWAPTPASYHQLVPIIRQTIDFTIENNKLMMTEDLSLLGRAGQAGAFGGGLTIPAISVEYLIKIGGFN